MRLPLGIPKLMSLSPLLWMVLGLGQPRDDHKDFSQILITTDLKPVFNKKHGTQSGTQI